MKVPFFAFLKLIKNYRKKIKIKTEVVDGELLDMYKTKATKIEKLVINYVPCGYFPFFIRSFLMSPYCPRVLGGF